jgi:hypothetical protein
MDLTKLNQQRLKNNLPTLKVKDNTGGGDCLYLSILDAGLNKIYPDLTVGVMRKAISEWCQKNENMYIRTMKETVLGIYNSFWMDTEPDYKEFIHQITIPGTWHIFNAEFIINVITDIYDIMITVVSNLPNSKPVEFYRFGKNTRKILEEDVIFIGHITEFHYVALIEDLKAKIRFVNPFGGDKREYPSYEEMVEDKVKLENEWVRIQTYILYTRDLRGKELRDRIDERNNLTFFLKNMNFIIIKREGKNPEEVRKVINKLIEKEEKEPRRVMYERTYIDVLNQFSQYEELLQRK